MWLIKLQTLAWPTIGTYSSTAARHGLSVSLRGDATWAWQWPAGLDAASAGLLFELLSLFFFGGDRNPLMGLGKVWLWGVVEMQPWARHSDAIRLAATAGLQAASCKLQAGNPSSASAAALPGTAWSRCCCCINRFSLEHTAPPVIQAPPLPATPTAVPTPTQCLASGTTERL